MTIINIYIPNNTYHKEIRDRKLYLLCKDLNITLIKSIIKPKNVEIHIKDNDLITHDTEILFESSIQCLSDFYKYFKKVLKIIIEKNSHVQKPRNILRITIID